MVYVKSHSCFINDPSRIECLQSRIALEFLLEAVKNIEGDEATTNKLDEEGDIAKLLPEDVQLYSSCKEGGNTGKKFTKKHINAILLLCNGVHVSIN